MCIAAGAITATEMAIGTTVASTTASMVAQAQQASGNAALIQGQEKLQQNQIAMQAGHEESAAQEARAAQAQSIAAAGAAGIDTGSNSFLASLQTTAMNASMSEQAIQESEQNSEQGSIAEADTQ